MALASSAVSTCGMTMPSAPPSSARVASAYCRDGTRTSGVIPAVSAAQEICTAMSSGMVPCSRSMNSQSKPQVAITAAMSTVRAWRSPIPSSPLARRSRAGLRPVISCPPDAFRPVSADITLTESAHGGNRQDSAVEGAPTAAQRVATDFASVPAAGLRLPIPPAAAHRREQRDAIEIALRLRADIAEAGLLGLALGIEHLQDADIAVAEGGARQAQRGLRRFERTPLRLEQFRIMRQRLERVGNLPERGQHGLPVGGERSVEGIDRRLLLRPQGTAMEDRRQQIG